MQISPISAGLRILQNLRFFAVNITQKDRQRRQACFCSLWSDKADKTCHYRIHVAHKKDNKLYVSLILKALVVDPSIVLKAVYGKVSGMI